MVEHYLDRLARSINENWNQPALTDFYLTEDGYAQDTSRGNHYTYGEMYAEILHLGEMFAALGLQRGDHIAICGANSAHWAIAYLAIAAYQGVAVTILHSQSSEDIGLQIDFSDAKAFFADPELWDELKDLSMPQVEHVISLENWKILRGKEIVNYQSLINNHQCQFVHGNLDELAMICFTSGSTGKSKGIMLSYRNISNNARNVDDIFPSSKNNVCVLTLPIAHMYSMSLEFIGQLCRAKLLYIIKETAIARIIKALRVYSPYMLCTVPAILESMVRLNSTEVQDFLKSLEHIQIGGARLNPDVENILSMRKIFYSVGYGTSETAPLIAMCTAGSYRQHSVGKPVGGILVRINTKDNEILAKGENVMLGYYKDPEATARKIDKDGWFHTGDKGHMDEDGYLYVEGRLEQDMIVLPNGENIHPEDIEHKINELPEVKESIVLAREGKLVAIVVPSIIENRESKIGTDALRRHLLRTINPELPLYSQLYDVEITDVPLQKTEKQTIKRYLYK